MYVVRIVLYNVNKQHQPGKLHFILAVYILILTRTHTNIVSNSMIAVIFVMYMSRSSIRLQTTQPTSGGSVTADSSYCANCVEPPRPQQWGPDLPCFGHAGHADPLDGWRCCSEKRVMSRQIQVGQL